MIESIVSILCLALCGALAYFVYILLKKYLEGTQNIRAVELQQHKAKDTLSLRLQAYERMMLLSERISIPNLTARLRAEGATANDLRLAMLIAIQQEFEHNVTQQIYVSESLWNILKVTRDNVADIINIVGQKVDPKADATVFFTELLRFMGEQGSDPIAAAQAAIRQEAALLF